MKKHLPWGAAALCVCFLLLPREYSYPIAVWLILLAACCTLAPVLELEPGLLVLPLLGAGVVWILVFGMLGLLVPGCALYSLALTALAFWGCWGRNGARTAEAFYHPVILILAAAGVAFWGVFATLKPMFVQWDEFTFWGTACRMVKEQNMLYPGAPGNLAARAYLPGMMMVSYLFQFSGAWAEWRCLLAYAFLFLAAFGACVSLPRRRWAMSVLLFGAAFLLPYFFSAPSQGAASKIYLTAMGDIPLGLAFGGAACVWLGTGHKKIGLALTASCLALLTLIKDMGLAYALIAVGVIFLDLCVRQEKYTLKNLARQIPSALVLALPVLVSFLGWSRYVALTASIDKNSVGSAGVSYAGMLIGGVCQLVGVGRTELFARLMGLMFRAFWQTTVCLLGPGLAAVGTILAVNAAAFLLAPRGQRRRVAMAFAAFAAAFAAFYLFHLFLYYYNFAEVEALALKDYDRYIGPYYLGWMLASLAILGKAAASSAMPRLSRLAVLGVSACVAFVYLWRGVPVGGFWDDLSSLYTLRNDVQARAEQANRLLGWDDTVLVISQGDDGTRWYYYTYELNATVAHGVGGYCRSDHEELDQWSAGFMNLVEAMNWELYEHQSVVTRPGLAYLLEERGCNYLLVDGIDRYFVEEFGPMFTEELPQDMGTEARLYRIEGRGEEMRFRPAEEVAP